MKKLILLSLFITSIFAQEKFVWPDILNDTELLAKYSCNNGTVKNKLFTDYKIENENLSSLIIKDKDGKQYIYSYNDKKKEGSIFVKHTYDALNEIAKTKVGKNLINRLISSKYKIYIKLGSSRLDQKDEDTNMWIGNNLTAIQNFDEKKLFVDKLPFYQIGNNVRLFYNPLSEHKFLEEDGVQRKANKSIILGHELYHAYDAIRGFLDRRFVEGPFGGSSEKAELRATKFENTLRLELKKKRRKRYGDLILFDENGNMAFADDPCINWL